MIPRAVQADRGLRYARFAVKAQQVTPVCQGVLDARVVAAQRLVGRVGRHEPHFACFATETFDGSFAVEKGGHGVAVVSGLLTSDGDDVAVPDRCIDHAVADHRKPTSSLNLGGLCLGTGGHPASTALSLTWVRSLRLWGRRVLGYLPYGKPSRRDVATASSNGPVPAWPGLCRSQRKASAAL